ncbi:MAG: protein of unknown function transrane [Verrucomicrobiaceae bacterium]|nr:protein of unknown function transrane [Verrucomicrobiaceae bacterium]
MMRLPLLAMPASSSAAAHPHAGGMLFGFLGVLSFSFTLPATRAAVASLDPMIVGLGRGVVAACLALPLLFLTRQRRPTMAQVRALAIVAMGVIVGFPVFSAWAMCHCDASHGAVVLGLLPLATAIAGVWRASDRPSPAFWCASVLGSLTVAVYALSAGGGAFRPADLALVAAVMSAAIGYAEGGRLARELGGWQVISWAVVLAAPVLIFPLSWLVWRHGLTATPGAWAGFLYLGLVSSFLGFFAWYHGLAAGGVARVSQLQLLQPFFTLAFASLFFGENMTFGGAVCAVLVAGSVYASKRCRVGGVRDVKVA